MRLVIADDDQLFQSTVASILNRYPKDYEIAAQIYDGETAQPKRRSSVRTCCCSTWRCRVSPAWRWPAA